MAWSVGYAVIRDTFLDVLTVSETPRAAMVNWLVAAREVSVTDQWTDEMISGAFETLAKDYQHTRVARVSIEEMQE